MYLGRWLTGMEGAARLAELRAQLDARDIADTQSTTGSGYSTFAPWMSSKRLRASQPASPYPFGPTASIFGPKVVGTREELQELGEYLHRDGNGDLRLIGAKDALQLKVEDPEEPWLEQTRGLAPLAIAQLTKVSPAFRQRIRTLCQILVPLGSNLPGNPRRDVGRGFSSHLFRGAIFMDPPATVDHRFEAYAINLAHELGHQAFFVYQSADPIIDGPLDAPVYSVIRMTDRPAIQSYHAVVAAAYMAEFIGDWLAKDGPDKPNSEYLRCRLNENITHVEGGIRALSALRYTDIGRQILDEMLDLAAYLRGAHGV